MKTLILLLGRVTAKVQQLVRLSFLGTATFSNDNGTRQLKLNEALALSPNGKHSSVWTATKDAFDNQVIRIKFRHKDCIRCADRPLCTRSKQGGRASLLKPQKEREAIEELRTKQTTFEWQERYNKRAGIEGSISQEVRAQGLRCSKYKGLGKTSLQHAATASATNLQRLADFWNGVKPEQTRTSQFLKLAA